MADITESSSVGPSIEVVKPAKPKHDGPRPPSKFQQLNKLYALPAPIRTFPLPTLIPHNPLSLFHVLYVWFSQTINRPSSHFDTLYQGWFSPETRSIHITDSRSIRGLWEQGFFGKGSLSRSEPSWLTREKKRRGVSKAIASEDVTRKRRAERQQTKWERARKEREAIDQTLLAEAKANELADPNIMAEADELTVQVDTFTAHVERGQDAVDHLPPQVSAVVSSIDFMLEKSSAYQKPLASSRLVSSPVGPLELLALPNSASQLVDVNNEILEEESMAHSLVGVDEFVPSRAALFLAPTGPMQILALPNSLAELENPGNQHHIRSSYPPTLLSTVARIVSKPNVFSAPVGPLELLALPNSTTDISKMEDGLNHGIERDNVVLNGYLTPPKSVELNRSSDPVSEIHSLSIQGSVSTITEDAINSSTRLGELIDANPCIPMTPVSAVSVQDGGSDDDVPENGTLMATVENRKSVRFSPTVEQTTFLPSQPPSPGRTLASTEEKPEAISELSLNEDMVIEDQEHFQLTMEEAFFLSYGLGALTILDPVTKSAISNQDLFSLFRKSSYFPPVSNPGLSTDDPFLINYVVYHHFRSLGWVVRGGIKFSVDYLLYNRGPVFSHAEFAVLILPSYSDPYWSSGPFLQNYVKGKEKRTWSWMHCINRVITQVKKTLILVYVDIPAPIEGKPDPKNGIDELLGKYKVREVVLKRWSPNRSRD